MSTYKNEKFVTVWVTIAAKRAMKMTIREAKHRSSLVNVPLPTASFIDCNSAIQWRPSASHNYYNYLSEGRKERLKVGQKKEVEMNFNEINKSQQKVLSFVFTLHGKKSICNERPSFSFLKSGIRLTRPMMLAMEIKKIQVRICSFLEHDGNLSWVN